MIIEFNEEPLITSYFLNGNDTNNTEIPFCKHLLLQEFGGKSLRVWDVAILVPNLLFLFFLLYKFRRTRSKLRSANSPHFTSLYMLVFGSTVINLIRCSVSMSISATNFTGGITDKVLWLLLKFFLLASELSVLSFGLLFGHLDSQRSIRRVLFVTAIVSLIYSTVQGVLEFKFPDRNFLFSSEAELCLFGHGGMLFSMVTSAMFALVYTLVCLLPLIDGKRRLSIPAKRSFYVYCALLVALNIMQLIGSALTYSGCQAGVCLVNLTSFLYFSFFSAVVYLIFLRGYFSKAQPGLLFSYKPQRDEVGELPNHLQGSSIGYYSVGGFAGIYSPDDELLYNADSLYDTTDLNSSAVAAAASMNPLYRRDPILVINDVDGFVDSDAVAGIQPPRIVGSLSSSSIRPVGKRSEIA